MQTHCALRLVVTEGPRSPVREGLWRGLTGVHRATQLMFIYSEWLGTVLAKTTDLEKRKSANSAQFHNLLLGKLFLEQH